MESGAPGDVPPGNCETKCASWLKQCNEDPTVDALAVLGQVVQKFMDQEPSDWQPASETAKSAYGKVFQKTN
jgi:hypothetical protein